MSRELLRDSLRYAQQPELQGRFLDVRLRAREGDDEVSGEQGIDLLSGEPTDGGGVVRNAAIVRAQQGDLSPKEDEVPGCEALLVIQREPVTDSVVRVTGRFHHRDNQVTDGQGVPLLQSTGNRTGLEGEALRIHSCLARNVERDALLVTVFQKSRGLA